MPGAKWSIVVWAVVTPDLEEFIGQDRKEAQTALLAGAGVFDSLDVHVFETHVSPGATATTTGAPGATHTLNSPPQGTRAKVSGPSALTTIDVALNQVTSWNDADHRMLVLWGHGRDAFPSKAPLARKVVAAVPSADTIVDVFTGDGKPGRPNIIGYDACRMAMVETALTLRKLSHIPTSTDDKACHLIASMVPEPATGWPYFQVLELLTGPWSNKADTVAAGLIEAYGASVGTPDWSMVAIDLAKVDPLAAALTGLIAATAPTPLELLMAAAGADIFDDTDRADLGALMRRLNADAANAGLPDPYPQARDVLVALGAARGSYSSGGRLKGRDGLAVRVGLPPGSSPSSVAAWAGWDNYLPDVPARL
jgi:hypothetical protein